MTWLVEDPVPVYAIGGLLAAVLVGVVLRTRRRDMLWALLGVIVVSTALVVLEWLVVTDRERIDAALDGAAAALEANDRDAVLGFVSTSPRATKMRGDVTDAMHRVTFEGVHVDSNRTITFNDLANPPTARAIFVASATVTVGGSSYSTGPRRVEVLFEHVQDRWRMVELTHRPVGSPR